MVWACIGWGCKSYFNATCDAGDAMGVLSMNVAPAKLSGARLQWGSGQMVWWMLGVDGLGVS